MGDLFEPHGSMTFKNGATICPSSVAVVALRLLDGYAIQGMPDHGMLAPLLATMGAVRRFVISPPPSHRGG
jgi:hypothetical protein